MSKQFILVLQPPFADASPSIENIRERHIDLPIRSFVPVGNAWIIEEFDESLAPTDSVVIRSHDELIARLQDLPDCIMVVAPGDKTSFETAIVGIGKVAETHTELAPARVITLQG